MNTLSDEQFKEEFISTIKAIRRAWMNRREMIKEDLDFDPEKYRKINSESGLICDLCSANGKTTDEVFPLKYIFEWWEPAIEIGTKEALIDAIDRADIEAQKKMLEMYGVDLWEKT